MKELVVVLSYLDHVRFLMLYVSFVSLDQVGSLGTVKSFAVGSYPDLSRVLHDHKLAILTPNRLLECHE